MINAPRLALQHTAGRCAAENTDAKKKREREKMTKCGEMEPCRKVFLSLRLEKGKNHHVSALYKHQRVCRT